MVVAVGAAVGGGEGEVLKAGPEGAVALPAGLPVGMSSALLGWVGS